MAHNAHGLAMGQEQVTEFGGQASSLTFPLSCEPPEPIAKPPVSGRRLIFQNRNCGLMKNLLVLLMFLPICRPTFDYTLYSSPK